MHILLAAVNSQYIHSNPALYALARGIEMLMPKRPRLTLAEYSINMPREQIVRELYMAKPDLIGFSVYIWNVEFIERLLADLRLLLPETRFIMGGPEATARAEELLARLPGLDAVMLGEGEELWPEFVSRLLAGDPKPALPGLLWQGAAAAPPAQRPDLDRLPFLYRARDLAAFQDAHKIIYYESSRGCPYSCSFCCSAREPLRERSVLLVLEEVAQLAETGCQIKFVDRTFNADPARALVLTQRILELQRPGLSWHFEISPYDLPEQLIELWAQAPPHYFNLEAGVQSLHPPSLAAIQRQGDWPAARANLARLMAPDNLHLHLDLIAGLPEETPESFAAGFAELHALMPHYLQLGFLKVLPGSRMAREAAKREIVHSPAPPYQVLRTPTMSADALFQLGLADRALNAFYNTGRFRQSLCYAAERWPGGALALYLELGARLAALSGGCGPPRRAELLAELLLPLDEPLFFDLLRLDWLSYSDNQPLPAPLRSPRDEKGRYHFQHNWQFGAAGLARPEPGPTVLVFDWRAPKLGASSRTPAQALEHA